MNCQMMGLVVVYKDVMKLRSSDYILRPCWYLTLWKCVFDNHIFKPKYYSFTGILFQLYYFFYSKLFRSRFGTSDWYMKHILLCVYRIIDELSSSSGISHQLRMEDVMLNHVTDLKLYFVYATAWHTELHDKTYINCYALLHAFLKIKIKLRYLVILASTCWYWLFLFFI